jgi:hypothetical protein
LSMTGSAGASTTTTSTAPTTTTTTTTPNQNQNDTSMLSPSALQGGGNLASNYAPPSSGDPVNDETGDLFETYVDASIPWPESIP